MTVTLTLRGGGHCAVQAVASRHREARIDSCTSTGPNRCQRRIGVAEPKPVGTGSARQRVSGGSQPVLPASPGKWGTGAGTLMGWRDPSPVGTGSTRRSGWHAGSEVPLRFSLLLAGGWDRRVGSQPPSPLGRARPVPPSHRFVASVLGEAGVSKLLARCTGRALLSADPITVRHQMWWGGNLGGGSRPTEVCARLGSFARRALTRPPTAWGPANSDPRLRRAAGALRVAPPIDQAGMCLSPTGDAERSALRWCVDDG